MKAFWVEVDAQGPKDKQVAYCRAALLPERKTYFRQMAAMTRLVELSGEDATTDLGPYLGHDHWRFKDHSRSLVMKLKGRSMRVARRCCPSGLREMDSYIPGSPSARIQPPGRSSVIWLRV